MRLGSLLPQDIPVEIWDENVGDIDYEALRPDDLVGLSGMTLNIDRARHIAERARGRCGAIVVGGVHATLAPEEVQEWADAVAVGEAFATFPRLVRDFQAGNLRPRYAGEGWMELKGLPPLRRDILDQVQENHKYWTPYLEITRGCPRDCSFCTAIRVSGRVMRLRPVEEVVDEINYRGLRRFFLTDDNFGLNFRTNPAYIEELFRAMRPLKLNAWTAQAEIIVANYPDLLAQAREAHADKFFVGFESVNPNNRKELGGKSRGVIEEYKRTIKRMHDAGMGIVGLFVFGFDADTPQVFQDTWDFIRESGLDGVSMTVMTPFPGTPLRADLVREGRLLDEPWAHYDTAHVTYRPARMTVDELRAAYDWICRKVYSPRRIAARGLRSLRRYPARKFRRKAFSSFGTDVGYWKAYKWRHWRYAT
jgi:radical SAM superfamily enzyme YgiQ (UPF0313 family)